PRGPAARHVRALPLARSPARRAHPGHGRERPAPQPRPPRGPVPGDHPARTHGARRGRELPARCARQAAGEGATRAGRAPRPRAGREAAGRGPAAGGLALRVPPPAPRARAAAPPPGSPTIGYAHPLVPAASLVTVVLGGGVSSRLWRDVRENRGLAY